MRGVAVLAVVAVVSLIETLIFFRWTYKFHAPDTHRLTVKRVLYLVSGFVILNTVGISLLETLENGDQTMLCALGGEYSHTLTYALVTPGLCLLLFVVSFTEKSGVWDGVWMAYHLALKASLLFAMVVCVLASCDWTERGYAVGRIFAAAACLICVWIASAIFLVIGAQHAHRIHGKNTTFGTWIRGWRWDTVWKPILQTHWVRFLHHLAFTAILIVWLALGPIKRSHDSVTDLGYIVCLPLCINVILFAENAMDEELDVIIRGHVRSYAIATAEDEDEDASAIKEEDEHPTA